MFTSLKIAPAQLLERSIDEARCSGKGRSHGKCPESMSDLVEQRGRRVDALKSCHDTFHCYRACDNLVYDCMFASRISGSFSDRGFVVEFMVLYEMRNKDHTSQRGVWSDSPS